MAWDQSRAPAFAAACGLHAALFIAALILGRPPMVLSAGSAVPVTLVAQAPAQAPAPAVADPVTQTAAAETPVAKAPPPQTPAAKATPVPPPQPTRPAPTPARPQPARPALNLDALEASLAKSAHRTQPALAKAGQNRAATASVARVAAGQGVSQNDAQGLQQLLERLWNVNCSVEAGDGVIVPITFTVGPDGYVLGAVTGGGQERASDPVVFAAARRAIDAARRAEPYGEAYRNRTFRVIFDAQKACAAR